MVGNESNCKVGRQVISRAELTRVTCAPGQCILDAGPFVDECRKCGAVAPVIS